MNKRFLLFCVFRAFRGPFIAPLLALMCLSPAIGKAGDAGRVNQVLVSLKTPKEGTGPEKFELLEDDVNAWTEVVVKSKRRLGVKKVEVDFQPGNRIGATAQINMDEIELSGFSISVFKSMLSGIQTLEAVGKLEINGKKGSYSVEEATFNGISVPAWVVNQVISYLSANQPPNVDITEPFDLPFGVTNIRVTPTAIEIVR